MTGNGTSRIDSSTGHYSWRAPVLRLEKSRGSNRFDDERNDDRHGAHSHSGETGRIKPSQFETDRTPQWNGPRLNPAFVAQVLGQILNKDEGANRPALAASYDSHGAVCAPVFDTRV